MANGDKIGKTEERGSVQWKRELPEAIEESKLEAIRPTGEPTALPFPQGKPRTKSIVVLVAPTGFFIMVFLAFFLEYVAKVRKRGSLGPVGKGWQQ